MDKEFKAAYKQLNKGQQQAVDEIEGPVLVVAGPGTGKTQLLSLRVANILKETDTDPTNVLCLTFTNFAATNMRDRLTQLVGAGAHNVMVRTFHSFAAEIMSLYPDYFWNGARLSVAPDTAQLEIIENILAQLPLDNPLATKFAGAYTALNDVAQAQKLAKEAGLTPEKLSAMLSVNEAYINLIEPLLAEELSAPLSLKKLPELQTAIEALPDQPIDLNIAPLMSLSTVLKDSLAQSILDDEDEGKTTQTGKWKRRWLQTVGGRKGMFDERRRNAWWQAVAGVYEEYRDTLHKRGYYDYSDMIIEVITQLEQKPELLASVQERFFYVLIDEFQDTNAAQLRLAHLVATHHLSEGKPNLMAVGDDDQSIFAFNGAELNNMLAFRRTYPTTKTIILTENYRSTQAVLDAADSIIEQAEDRLVKRENDLSKRLLAMASPGKGVIEHLTFPTREHQLSAIARRIQKQWQPDSAETVAVLARNHSSLRELSGLLNKLGVPVRYEQQNNILNNPLIQQICILAETVTAIAGGDTMTVNHHIAQLLQHPVWGLDSKGIWQLAAANYSKPNWLDSLLSHKNDQEVAFGKWLLWLAEQAASEPLPVILDYLIGLRAGEHLTSPLRKHFLALNQIDNIYLEGLSAVRVLKTVTSEFAAMRVEATTLDDFVRFVRLHRDLDRPITDQSWFVSGEQAVQLMTVHKAKGLEFDSVFVIDAIEDNWRPRRSGRKPPANLPLQPYGEQYDDYVRLLYVAVTRAKKSITLSSFQTDEQGKAILATPLINQLPASATDASKTEDPISVLESTLAWPRLESKDERALLKNRLDNYSLSVTALLQFLDVASGGPQYFLERNMLRVPEMTTASMAYGTAIHKALQIAQQLTSADKFSLQDVFQGYESCLEQQQLSQAETERYKAHGLKTLASLFKDKGFTLRKSGQAEIAINDLQLGAARLGGKLDRIDQEDGELLITDYKTGKPLSSFVTRDQTKAVKAWRNQSQLLFYILLARQSSRFKNINNIKAQITYVEAETPKELTLALVADDDALERLKLIIGKVWQHIADLNFPDTRHYQENAQGIAAFEDDLLNDKI